MAKVERTVSINVDVAQAKKEIEALKNEIKELRDQLRELSKESIEYGVIAAKLAEVNKKLTTATKELNNAVKQQIDLTKELNKSKSDTDKAEEQRIKRQQHQKKIIEDLEKQIKELVAQLEKTSSSNKDYAETLEKIKQKQANLKDAQDKYTSSMRDSEKQTKSSTDASKSMSDKLDELSDKQKQANEQIKKTPDVSTALNKNSEAMREAAKQAGDSNMSMNQQGKTIEQLNKEFRDLKKAIESTVPGSKEHLKLIDDLKNKQQELNLASVDYDRALGKQRKSLGGINENFKFTGQSLGELKQLQKQLNKEILELPTTSPEFKRMAENIRLVETTVRDYQRELKGTKSLQQNIEDALRNSGQAAKSSERNIEDLTRSLNELRAAQKKVGANTQDFEDIEKAVNEVNDALEKEKKIANDVAKSLGKQESTFTKISNGFKQSIGAIPGLIAANLGADALKQFGGEILNTAKQFDQLKLSVQQVTGASGESLNELTASVKATADTFGADFNEVFTSANSLSKQMGISFEEASNLINKGFLDGANVQGEFLGILKEFPTQFQAAGFSAEEFINLTTQVQKEGVFSNKGLDVIKEFGLRIREGTQGAKDALTDAFGEEFTKDLFKGINDGSLTTQDALQKVSAAMRDTSLSVEKEQKVIADVFGGAGEDAGAPLIKGLDRMIEKSKESAKETNKLREQQKRLLEANEDLNESLSKLSEELGGTGTTFDELKIKAQAFVVDAIITIISWFKTLKNAISENKEILIGLGIALTALNFTQIIVGLRALWAALKAQQVATKAATAAQWALNVAMQANPLSIIVTAIAAIIAIFLEMERKFKVFSTAWESGTKKIKIAWDNFKKFFTNSFKAIGDFLDNFGGGIGKTLRGIFTFDSKMIKDGFNDIKDSFSNLFTSISGFWDDALLSIQRSFGTVDKELEKRRREQDKFFQSQRKSAEANEKELELIRKRGGRARGEIEFSLEQELKLRKAIIDDLEKSNKLAEENKGWMDGIVDSTEDMVIEDNNKLIEEQRKAIEKIDKQITENNKKIVEGTNLNKDDKDTLDRKNKALEKQRKLQEAINKLRLEAEIELVGGEDTIDAIQIFRERAIKELKKAEGFSFLNPEEQEALLNKVNKIYDEKLKQLGANTIKEQEETLNEQLELQLWFIEQQEKLLQRQSDMVNASFEDSLEDQELLYDKQLFNLNNRLEQEQKAIEQLNKDFEDGLIDAATFEKRSKELVDAQKRTLDEIAELEIRKIKTQQAGTELQIQSQMELMDQEAKIFKDRLANERKFLEAKIALQPKGLATQEQKEQLQALLDTERDFDQKQLIDKEKLNNDLEKSRFDSSVAIQNIQKGLNKNLESLDGKQNDNTEKAASRKKEIEDKKWQDVEEAYRKGVEAIQSALDTISQIQLAGIESEIEASQNRIDSNNDTIAQLEESQEGASERQKERIEKQIKVVKKSNEEETKNIEKQEREKAEIERRSFLISQTIAIADVAINTARSIAATIANPVGALTGGLPWSAINAAIGAAQIAAIVAQTVTAKFAEGGIYKGGNGQGGVVFGRRHAQGGIHMNSGRAELEDGEIILTRGVFLDPTKRAIASALNRSAGGVGFEKGGVYSNINSLQLTPRLTPSKFEFGGLYKQKFQAGGVVLPDLMSTQSSSKAIISGFKDALKDMPNPVVAVDEINTAQSNVAVIEDNII